MIIQSYTRHVITASILLIAACGTINLFPISEDRRLGAEFHSEIVKDAKNYKPLHNRAATEYVQNIVNRITGVPGIEYKSVFAQCNVDR